MDRYEAKSLQKGDTVMFAGILSTEARYGTFVKIINDHLVLIDYGTHTEQNHIANILKIDEEDTNDLIRRSK